MATTAVVFALLVPFLSAAPTEERLSPPSDGFIELYSATTTEENSSVNTEPSQPKEVSKASMTPQPPPPHITIPVIPPSVPLVFPRPFSIPFPLPFPVPPPPHFPNLDVVQVIAVPRPQKNLQQDDDESDDDLSTPADAPEDSVPEGRRAPVSGRRKKKPKKPKKQKKQKKQKKPKKPKNPGYPQPIIIYQNQEEAVGSDGGPQQPPMGLQGGQSSYLGYYMVYVVEVRWTGNNYTQTVVTGRPLPAAITLPTSTESGLVNNLSETIVPASLVNGGNRPQPTPACLFQRSTTTEGSGSEQEVLKPLESTDVAGETEGVNQEQIGEEAENSEEEAIVAEEEEEEEEEYEDESDPKKKVGKKKKKKKKTNMKGIMVTSSTPGGN